MKKFTDYIKFVNEAYSMERLNSRVSIDDTGRPFTAEFGLRISSDMIIGAVAFGSVGVHRTLIVDKNHAYDIQIGRSKFVARIQNSLTSAENGYVQNATLAKFDLEKGTMWLAEEDAEDGSIQWGRGFKFKSLILQGDVAQSNGWIQ